MDARESGNLLPNVKCKGAGKVKMNSYLDVFGVVMQYEEIVKCDGAWEWQLWFWTYWVWSATGTWNLGERLELKLQVQKMSILRQLELRGAGNGNVKADSTEGWAEDIVQENKNATFVCDIGPWEVRRNSRDSWSTKSCTTNKIFGSTGDTNGIQCCQIQSVVARSWVSSFSRDGAGNSREAVRPEDKWAMRKMRLLNGFLFMKSDSMQKHEMGQQLE